MKIFLVGHKGLLGSIFSKNIKCDFSEYKYPQKQFVDLIKKNKYDVIINCAVNKNSDEITNVELPKFLSNHTNFLVHFSSDAVFSGNKKPDDYYEKSNKPDPVCDYGKQKYASEDLCDSLIIRTSFIDNKSNFVQDIINNKRFLAYQNYFWSGLCSFQVYEKTIEMITKNKRGLYNLFSNQTLSKYELACLVSEKYNGAEIIPIDNPIINRKIKSDFDINFNIKFL